MKKVKNLQLDDKGGPLLNMEQDEVVTKTEEDEIETYSNVPQQQLYNNANINNASLNNSNEATPYYGAPSSSSSVSAMNVPTNSCCMSASSGPVMMVCV